MSDLAQKVSADYDSDEELAPKITHNVDVEGATAEAGA